MNFPLAFLLIMSASFPLKNSVVCYLLQLKGGDPKADLLSYFIFTALILFGTVFKKLI